jgi:hypothetical protein
MYGVTSKVGVTRYNCDRNYIYADWGHTAVYNGEDVVIVFTCELGHSGGVRGRVSMPPRKLRVKKPKPHTVLWLYRDEVDA